MDGIYNHNTIKIRGPGRPPMKDAVQLTLYIDKKVKDTLKYLSQKYNLSMSEIVENLVLKEFKGDKHVLELNQKNKQLERKMKELQKENEKLKKRLEKVIGKSIKEKDSLEKIREKIEEIFKNKKEVKVVEIVRAVYGLPSGDSRIKEKAEKFLNDYFERKDGKLISEELGLEIEEVAQYQTVGWRVKKRQTH